MAEDFRNIEVLSDVDLEKVISKIERKLRRKKDDQYLKEILRQAQDELGARLNG